MAEKEEIEEKISEKDTDGTVENIVDIVSSYEFSDYTSDSDYEPVIPVRKNIEPMPINTVEMFDSYNKMSRKQRRKFEKGNKKKRK